MGGEADTAFQASWPFFSGTTPEPAMERARARIAAGVEHPLVAYGNALGIPEGDMAREAGLTVAQWDEWIVRRGHFPPVKGLINLSLLMGVHPAAFVHPRAAFTPPEILEAAIAMVQSPVYHFSDVDRRTALGVIRQEWGRIYAAENDPENGRNLLRFRQVDLAVLSEQQAGKSRAFSRMADDDGDHDSLSFMDDPWADETLHVQLQGPDRMMFYIGALKSKIDVAQVEYDASVAADNASLKRMNDMMARLWGFREQAARRGVAAIQKEASGKPDVSLHDAVVAAFKSGDERIPAFYNDGVALAEYGGQKLRVHSQRVDAFLSMLQTRMQHLVRHVKTDRRLKALKAELKAHLEWIADSKDDETVMGLYDNRCRLVARGLKLEPQRLLAAPGAAAPAARSGGGAGLHPIA